VIVCVLSGLSGLSGVSLTILGMWAKMIQALPSIRVLGLFNRGPVAQLGARFHGMEEVVGSIPTRSTIFSTTCRGDIWPTISLRSGADLGPPRKLPVFRGHFHLFPLFDEEGNADFQARLQPGCLGPAARRVAPNRGFRVGNVQFNEYWQL
jgi:hypothetical protein